MSSHEWLAPHAAIVAPRYGRISIGATCQRQLWGIETRDDYPSPPFKALPAYKWPGAICRAFVLGEGDVDWTGADALRGKLDALLKESRGSGVEMIRVARLYDDRFIFLLKSDRLRFWTRSIALRDADDVLADLRFQGI